MREALIQCLRKLILDGKDIFAGYYYGGDPANIQLSCTRCDSNGATRLINICYCHYGVMWNFQVTEEELCLQTRILNPDEQKAKIKEK